MFSNIIDHSVQVKNVALLVYERLRDPDSISRGILIAAALLHDIAKTKSIVENLPYHDRMGGEIIRNLGYDYVAEIVENHVVFKDFDENGPISEKDIIYYADKRVMHDQIVTIEERIKDIAQRYGKSEDDKKRIEESIAFVRRVEKKIAKHTTSSLDFSVKLK